MRITKDIYLVGSGNFGISNMTDCNVYLVGTEESYALIDAGGGLQTEKILENIGKHGINIKKIKYLILTHAHWDHAGGCHGLVNALNCRVYAHSLSVSTLGTSNWPGTPIEDKKNKFGVKVDVEIDDNTTINLGHEKFRFIHTPGHSADGISLFGTLSCGPTLFSGDTVLTEGKIGVVTNQSNLQEYTHTVRTLLDLKPDTLFPGHGTFTLTNASVHLQLSWERVKSSWYQVVPGPTPFNPSWWWTYSKGQ